MKKILAVMFTAVLLAACSNNDSSKDASKTSDTTAKAVTTQTAATTVATQTKPDTPDATKLTEVSYAIGYIMAEQLKQQNIAINTQTFAEGLNTALAAKPSKYNQEETTQIMTAFQQEMMQKAQVQQQQEQTKMQAAVLEQSAKLLNDPNTPTVGPNDAKVAVIEFFDYQCAYCSKVAPEIEALIPANPNVKFIFKDYPIFAERWEASKYAAEVGLAAYQQGGADLYIKYHNAIFATGKDEGKLKNVDIDTVAKQVGVKLSANKSELTGANTEDQIKSNMTLASKDLGIMGTPAFIIMPTTGANASNTTVVPGFASEESLQQAIDKASKG